MLTLRTLKLMGMKLEDGERIVGDGWDRNFLDKQLDIIDAVLDMEDITYLSPESIENAIQALREVWHHIDVNAINERFQDEVSLIVPTINKAQSVLQSSRAEAWYHLDEATENLFSTVLRWGTAEIDKVFKRR